MKKNKFLFFLSAILLVSCTESAKINEKLIEFNNSEKSFKREIPTLPNGKFDHFYTSTKNTQKHLGLDSLENGFAGLQIRIWYDDVYFTKQKLVIITYKMENWTANLYTTKNSAMLSKEYDKLIPKTGWVNFSNRLLSFNILTLPNGNGMLNCGAGGGDGSSYNVEISTRKHYRYYGYSEPEYYKNECPEAKSMYEIIRLLTEELGI